MSTSQKHIELIEGYLNNNLSREDMSLVEDLLKSDDEFLQMFKEEELLRDLIEVRGDEKLKEVIAKEEDVFKKNKSIRKNFYLIAGVVGVLLLTTILVIQSSSNKDEGRITKDLNDDLLSDELKPELDENLVRQPEKTKVQEYSLPKNESKILLEEGVENNLSEPQSVSIDTLNEDHEVDQDLGSDDEMENESNKNPCDDVVITGVFMGSPSCSDSATGLIYLGSNISGGKQPYTYQLGNNIRQQPRFEKLLPGQYEIIIIDDQNCKSEVNPVSIGSKNCPIVKDFSISPSIGEKWTIPLIKSEEGRLQIYNEVGTLVLDKVVQSGDTWDGMNGGQILNFGAYAYTLQVSNGKVITGFVSIVP